MALLKRKPKEQPEIALVEAPPAPAEGSPAYWQQRIADVVQDQMRMRARQAEIENELAARYGQDNEALETEYARLNVRYNASGKVIEQYRQNGKEAAKAEIVATFQREMDRYTTDRAELLAYEADTWPAIEAAYLAGLEKRRAWRVGLVHIQRQAPHDVTLAARAQFGDDSATIGEVEAQRRAISDATPGWNTTWKRV